VGGNSYRNLKLSPRAKHYCARFIGSGIGYLYLFVTATDAWICTLRKLVDTVFYNLYASPRVTASACNVSLFLRLITFRSNTFKPAFVASGGDSRALVVSFKDGPIQFSLSSNEHFTL
jgi:hypothetical protein